MKRITYLLVCFFAVTVFQLSLGNLYPSVADSSLSFLFTTPEQTWDHFKTAILVGDFDAAKKCCSTGKTKSVFRFEKMDDEKRKNLMLSMQPIKKIDLQENTAKYKLVRDINGVGFSTFIYFEKVADEWKIARY